MLELRPETKACSRCKAIKQADRANFSYITSRSVLHSWCKACCAEDRRRDRAANPARYRALHEKRDVERNREQQRIRYHANPERNREQRAKRTPEQNAQYNANRRARRDSDPAYAETVRQRTKASLDRNRDKYAARRRKAWAEASPSRRIRTYFTSAICHSLKGTTKGGKSWEAILGYSAADLIAHLERQFTKGMTWDNYGEWHVDHIVPVASFTITSAQDDEFKSCWALSNLRPLWAQENFKKRAKRLHLI